jgi:uncharacterized protein YyaL (SSP411 family)
MERESFENEQIAALMNQHFVCIKVDREERPDLDSIYMQAVQAMTQQGGWPMTMFLTPEGKPFYGGTYYPPEDKRYGQHVMPGFRRILRSLAEAFVERRQEVEEQAGQLAEYLQDRSSAPLRAKASDQQASLTLFEETSRKLAADFDPEHGGFGSAPKFPNSMLLEFLLRLHLHRQHGEMDSNSDAAYSELKIVEHSLQQMARGGIYDQLGGGFHRYSVDNHWLVPHFEKMLYDNALLSRLYLHAYLVTGKDFYRRIVEEALDYVVREMTAPEGGFYSTQDADSEGEEGKFFVWSVEEIDNLLSPADAALFKRYYGVTPEGNFEGKNILYMPLRADQAAEETQIGLNLEMRLQKARQTLFAAREQRVKPGRDEKILTAWNGLMLRSVAEAARYLERDDYLQVARRNAEFLLTTMRQDGRLLRTAKDGRAHIKGYLEDYAFLADGLLALYEASFEPRWLDEARSLIEQAITLFADEQNGGFFDTGSDAEQLISRPKDIMDNATPAGNSVAVDVLLRLAALTGEQSYRERAESYLQGLAEISAKHPQAFGYVLGALDFVLAASREIAIIGHQGADDTRALLNTLRRLYLPNSVLASSAPDDTQAVQSVPLLAERPLVNGQAAAYVCQNFACQAPITSPETLLQTLVGV